MIHYHGGPITPETCALRAWKGRHAFVSFAHPQQVELAASVCQSFALDNGAFSVWRGTGENVENWWPYYKWCERWFRHPACDWAVIPDVIGGTEDENDALLEAWPFDKHLGVPVWHLDESSERLTGLVRSWPRVALGSAAQYDVSRPSACLSRLAEVWDRLDPFPSVKLHGLRMLNPAIISRVPLSSADSTNVARNIGIDGAWRGSYPPATKEGRVDVLVERIESVATPAVLLWENQPELFEAVS